MPLFKHYIVGFQRLFFLNVRFFPFSVTTPSGSMTHSKGGIARVTCPNSFSTLYGRSGALQTHYILEGEGDFYDVYKNMTNENYGIFPNLALVTGRYKTRHGV